MGFKKNEQDNDDIDFSVYLEGIEELKPEQETAPAKDFPEETLEKKQEKETKTAEPEAEPEAESTAEDIENISSEDKPSKGRLKNWWKRRSKGQRVAIIVVAVILLIIIAAGIFVWSKLNLIDTSDDYTGSDIIDDEINVSDIDSITEASSLHDYLKKWATNGGEKMSASYVTNILLVGQDSTSGLTDTMMLVSLNQKTKKISMVSFYRDSWTYFAPDGKKERYHKLNHGYAYGGAKCMVETIENNYKIKIDDYVMVNYDSFPKIIDALGGVDVYVEPKVASYINSSWQQWTRTGNPVSFSAGTNHLNGEKALMFCRIRKLDSDINRTERQRRVISAIMASFKNASLSQMNSAANALLPNIKTDMGNAKILSMVADAVSGGWLNYPISQATMPSSDTGKLGWVGDQSVWLVDYEGAAYQLQMLLYGTSNIELSDDRVSPITIKESATATTTTSSSGSTKRAGVTEAGTTVAKVEGTKAPSETTTVAPAETTTQAGSNTETTGTAGTTSREDRIRENLSKIFPGQN